MNLKKTHILVIIFLIIFAIFTIVSFLINRNNIVKITPKKREIVAVENQIVNNSDDIRDKKDIKIDKKINNNKLNVEAKYEKTMEEKIEQNLLENFDFDIVFGDLNAVVTIIEYSSFTCSHCIKMHNNVMKKLKQEYIDTKKVKFIHRAMVNSRTIFSKMLQHCVNKNFAFNFTTDLFNTSGEWAYSENLLDQLKILSFKYGMNEASFDKCIKDKELGQGIINKQVASSKILKINSTPTLFINKERFSGARGYKELKKIIDTKLLEMK